MRNYFLTPLILAIAITSNTQAEPISGVVKVDGTPQPGVLIYVAQLGIVATNSEGIFEFTDGKIGIDYTATPKRLGVNFLEASYNVNTSSTVEILGNSEQFNPFTCTEKDLSGVIVTAGDTIKDSLSIGASLLGKLGERSQSRFSRMLSKRFRDYFTVSQRLPEVALDCSLIKESTCSIQSLAKLRKATIRAGKRFNNVISRVNTVLQKTKNNDHGRNEFKSFKQQLIQKSKLHRNQLRGIPNKGYICSK